MTLTRSKSNFDRPYISRLTSFKRVTNPSVGPLLSGRESPASTAARSRSMRFSRTDALLSPDWCEHSPARQEELPRAFLGAKRQRFEPESKQSTSVGKARYRAPVPGLVQQCAFPVA